MTRVPQKFHSGLGGYRADLGCYFRSQLEANYARYLDWLLANGKIYNWVYEPRTFEFPEKYGPKYYVPDFKVIYADRTHYWVETKGFMDHASKVKLKRFRKHFPAEVLTVVGYDQYNKIKDKLGKTIPGWEGLK